MRGKWNKEAFNARLKSRQRSDRFGGWSAAGLDQW
jgi:hypothetical protein